MADNSQRTPGTGEAIAADEVTDGTLGSCKVQFVKIMDGTLDGTTKAAVGAGGLAVTEGSGSAIKTAVELIDDAVYVDDADWTDSTSKHVLVGGLYQATPQTITDGDVGPLEVDANGKLLIGNPSIAGTAGTPNAGVLSVQGVTSMTALEVAPTFAVAKCVQWSHYSQEFTTTQTSTDLVAASGSMKFYIGRITIGTGGTTAGLVTVYFGTSSYSAGTSKTVFRANFAPSATAYPGVVIGSGVAPFIISAASDALKITTSAGITVYVQVDYIRV